MGTIEVELYVKHAPRTCKNFLELARKGYYNGTIVSPAPLLISCFEGLPCHVPDGDLRVCCRHIGSSATS